MDKLTVYTYKPETITDGEAESIKALTIRQPIITQTLFDFWNRYTYCLEEVDRSRQVLQDALHSNDPARIHDALIMTNVCNMTLAEIEVEFQQFNRAVTERVSLGAIDPDAPDLLLQLTDRSQRLDVLRLFARIRGLDFKLKEVVHRITKETSEYYACERNCRTYANNEFFHQRCKVMEAYLIQTPNNLAPFNIVAPISSTEHATTIIRCLHLMKPFFPRELITLIIEAYRHRIYMRAEGFLCSVARTKLQTIQRFNPEVEPHVYNINGDSSDYYGITVTEHFENDNEMHNDCQSVYHYSIEAQSNWCDHDECFEFLEEIDPEPEPASVVTAHVTDRDNVLKIPTKYAALSQHANIYTTPFMEGFLGDNEVLRDQRFVELANECFAINVDTQGVSTPRPRCLSYSDQIVRKALRAFKKLCPTVVHFSHHTIKTTPTQEAFMLIRNFIHVELSDKAWLCEMDAHLLSKPVDAIHTAIHRFIMGKRLQNARAVGKPCKERPFRCNIPAKLMRLILRTFTGNHLLGYWEKTRKTHMIDAQGWIEDFKKRWTLTDTTPLLNALTACRNKYHELRAYFTDLTFSYMKGQIISNLKSLPKAVINLLDTIRTAVKSAIETAGDTVAKLFKNFKMTCLDTPNRKLKIVVLIEVILIGFILMAIPKEYTFGVTLTGLILMYVTVFFSDVNIFPAGWLQQSRVPEASPMAETTNIMTEHLDDDGKVVQVTIMNPTEDVLQQALANKHSVFSDGSVNFVKGELDKAKGFFERAGTYVKTKVQESQLKGAKKERLSADGPVMISPPDLLIDDKADVAQGEEETRLEQIKKFFWGLAELLSLKKLHQFASTFNSVSTMCTKIWRATNIGKFFKRIVNGLSQLIAGVDLVSLEDNQAKWEWILENSKTINTYVLPTAFNNAEQTELITKWVNEVESIKPYIQSDKAIDRALWMSILTQHKEVAKKLIQWTRKSITRPEPPFIPIIGGAGKGKSILAEFIMAGVYNALRDPKDLPFNKNHQIYPRKSGTEYWEQYSGQFAVYYDDFCQTNDVDQRRMQVMEIIDGVSSAVYPLNMAFESKGQVDFTSKMVVATMNKLPDKDFGITDFTAFQRRWFGVWELTDRIPVSDLEDPERMCEIRLQLNDGEFKSHHNWFNDNVEYYLDEHNTISVVSLIKMTVEYILYSQRISTGLEKAINNFDPLKYDRDQQALKLANFKPVSVPEKKDDIEHYLSEKSDWMHDPEDKAQGLIELALYYGASAVYAAGVGTMVYGGLKLGIQTLTDRSSGPHQTIPAFTDVDSAEQWLITTTDVNILESHDKQGTLHGLSRSLAAALQEQPSLLEAARKILGTDIGLNAPIVLTTDDPKKVRYVCRPQDAEISRLHERNPYLCAVYCASWNKQFNSKGGMKFGVVTHCITTKSKSKFRASLRYYFSVYPELTSLAIIAGGIGTALLGVMGMIGAMRLARGQEQSDTKGTDRHFKKLQHTQQQNIERIKTHITAHGVSPSLAPIAQSVSRNIVYCHFYGDHIHKAHMLFVKGRTAVCVKHIFESDTIHTLEIGNIMTKNFSVDLDRDRDLAYVTINEKGLNAYRDISSHVYAGPDRGFDKVVRLERGLDDKNNVVAREIVGQYTAPCEFSIITHYGNFEMEVSKSWTVDGAGGEPGDCGSPYCVYDGTAWKVLGIHIGCNTRTLEGRLTRFIVPKDESWNEAQGVFLGNYDIDYTKAQLVPGTEPVGTLMKNNKEHKAFMPSETKIVPTVVQELTDLPVTRKPAQLKPFSTEDGVISPKQKVMAKFGALAPVVRPKYMPDCRKVAERLFPTKYRKKYVLLTDEQAVFGSPEHGVPPVDHSTGSGVPFVLDHLTKADLYDIETKVITVLLKEAIRAYETNALQKLTTPSYVSDILKDELRDLLRVLQGKTRLFSAGNIAHLIWCRKYLGKFCTDLEKLNVESFCSVGINPKSSDWARLYEKVTSNGRKVDAGDFSSFDISIPPWLTIDVYHVLIYAMGLDGDKRYKPIRRNIFAIVYSCLHAYHICSSNVYKHNGGNSSGNYLTSIINCIVNSLVHEIVWLNTVPDFIKPDYNKYVFENYYGDDTLNGIDPLVLPLYNMQTLKEGLKKFCGMTYTASDKSDDVRTYLEPGIDKIIYLQREVCAPHGVAKAKLALDIIISSTQWRMKNRQTEKEWFAACSDSAFSEFYLHGRTVFDDMLEKYRPVFQYHKLPLPSWTTYVRQFANGYPDH